MKSRHKAVWAAIVCFYLGAGCLITPQAQAQTQTATMALTASVPVVCSVSVTPTIAFGSYTNTVLTGTGSVTGNCTNNSAYTITASPGGLNTASCTQRGMLPQGQAGSVLVYNIYLDAAYTKILCDGTGGSYTISATGTGSPQTTPLYMQVPGGQQANLNAGNFADSVIFTLTY